MLGIAAQLIGGWVYGHLIEYSVHRWLLHGLGKKRKNPLSYHWHGHHRNSRQNNFFDPIYQEHPFKWNAAGKELLGLTILTAMHIPIFWYLPWFGFSIGLSVIRYYQVHKKSHNDPGWTKKKIPWHYDHHMGLNQDANYGVRSDKFDHLFGTRKVFLDRKDI